MLTQRKTLQLRIPASRACAYSLLSYPLAAREWSTSKPDDDRPCLVSHDLGERTGLGSVCEMAQ